MVFLGIVVVFLGLKELLPILLNWIMRRKLDVMGGFFCGPLGGLVSKRGAIRSATALVFAGTLIGMRLLPYFSMERFRRFVAAMVIVLGISLIAGL